MIENPNQKLAFALAMVILGSTPVAAGSLNDQKAAAQQKKNQVQQSLNQKAAEIGNAKSEASAVSAEIQRLDEDIQVASVQIQQLNGEIGILQGEIEKTRQELQEAKDKLEENKERFGKRMRLMYMSSDTSYLEILLNSGDLESLLGNAKLISHIAKQDAKLIDEIKAQVQEIEEKKAQLDAQEKQLQDAKAQVEVQKSNLESSSAAKQSYMAQLESNIAMYEAEYNAMVESSYALESEINSIQNAINEEARQAELARRAEEAKAAEARVSASRGVTQSNRTNYVGQSAPAPAAKPTRQGTMYWPVPGYSRVSSPYGYRTHPILKTRRMHTGIDIPGPSGTAVVAAKDGVVITSRFMNGYGNCIMVDHGDTVTVYAHLSARNVSPGQRVSGGQTIGQVGSTGMSTGPHLHFEVRVNGSTTNPLNYL